MTTRLATLAAVLCLLPHSPLLAKPKVEPTLSFTSDTVLVHVAPRSSIALFGMSWEVINFGITIHHRADLLTDVDGDGWIRRQLTPGLVTRSVWTAVDLAGGKSSTAVAPEYEMIRLPFPAGNVGQADVRLHSMGSVYAFVARPRAGGWVASAGDGEAGDLDPNFDVLDIGVGSFVPLGSTPTLTRFSRGDVVFVVDLGGLKYTVRRVQ